MPCLIYSETQTLMVNQNSWDCLWKIEADGLHDKNIMFQISLSLSLFTSVTFLNPLLFPGRVSSFVIVVICRQWCMYKQFRLKKNNNIFLKEKTLVLTVVWINNSCVCGTGNFNFNDEYYCRSKSLKVSQVYPVIKYMRRISAILNKGLPIGAPGNNHYARIAQKWQS